MSTGWSIFWIVVFLVVVVLIFRREPHKPRKPVSRPIPREPEEPQVRGLEALEQLLERQRIDDESDRRQQEEQRNRLLALWAHLEPTLMQAVEIVNNKLAQHGELRLVPRSKPEFMDTDYDAYGIRYRVEGIFDSSVPLVVTEDQLFVAGFYNWSEGIKIPINAVSTETVADALANGVKWAIEG
jgi:hypothetical protein